jgi:WD40-like Beta Propeller Repeat
MKIKNTSIIILTFLMFLGCSSSDWQYLGQERPGEMPEIFAPGIISGISRLHTYPAISPDGKQILWMTLPPKIMEVHYENGEWSNPAPYEPLKDIMALRPEFDQRGNLLFSSAQIPDGKGGQDIWQLNEKGEFINFGGPINTPNLENCPSFTKTGDIYYSSYVQGKRWDRGILMSKFIKGKYSDPTPLPETINIPNKEAIDYLSYVSPDGSYILFSSNRHDTSKESCSIYVSYKDKNDSWGPAKNLSHFLGHFEDTRDPAISSDGKYLFFSSGKNIMWVKTSVIYKCKRSI